MSRTRKEWAGLIGAGVAGALVFAAPTPSGLPPEGQRMAALFTVTLILWVTEAFPVAVTALVALALQPIFGIAPLPAALAAFMSPVFFFVIAMFAIARAIVSSGLDKRFALWLLARAGTDSRRVLGAFLVGTAAISTVVSDVPCTALFMAIALGLLEKMSIRPGESNFGKALMMGIPIAAFIGGVGTPAGSAINVLGLGFIQQHGQVTVPFLHWMAIGIPMVIVLLPVAWWALLWAYPPEMATIGELGAVTAERAALGRMRPVELKVLAILAAMLTLWILSTWYRELDVV